MDKFNKKTLSKTGEFGLIDFIKKNNTRPSSKHNIVTDIGDDCFCFKADKNARYAVTTDILIENVHFKTGWSKPGEIAQKAVEANVSDIASMGNVTPLYLFIAIGIPKQTPASYITKIHNALKNTCKKYSIHISGGDTVRSQLLTISITLIGICNQAPVTRHGARINDLICATGTFGDSGAGFDILSKGKKRNNLKPFEKNLVKKHIAPAAKLDIAQKLLKNFNITSMTDSSDGLFKSVELLTKDSGKGAVINTENIPLSKDLIKYAGSKKLYDYALFGAEEFELVFTTDPKDRQKLQKLFPCVSFIGKIDDTKEVKYFKNGKKLKIENNIFKHF